MVSTRAEAEYGDLQFSPDGTRIAVNKGHLTDGSEDIWVLDAETGIGDRLSFSNDANRPSWGPEGRIVYYDGDFGAMPAYCREPEYIAVKWGGVHNRNPQISRSVGPWD